MNTNHIFKFINNNIYLAIAYIIIQIQSAVGTLMINKTIFFQLAVDLKCMKLTTEILMMIYFFY